MRTFRIGLFVLFILSSAAALPCSATQDLQYLVYVEDEYYQGPWREAEALTDYELRFLRPMMFTDMVGTVPIDIPGRILGRLKAHHPEWYGWEYELSIEGDMLVIETGEKLPGLKRLKNEVVLSMTALSDIRRVRFATPGRSVVYTRSDVDIPWFSLRRPISRADSTEPEPHMSDSARGFDSANATVDSAVGEDYDTADNIAPVELSDAPGDTLDESRRESGLSVWMAIGGVLIAGILGYVLGRVRRGTA